MRFPIIPAIQQTTGRILPTEKGWGFYYDDNGTSRAVYRASRRQARMLRNRILRGAWTL